MKELKSALPKALMIFIIMTLVCGVLYTGAVTIAAQLIASEKANGSIIEIDGRKYGSELLGQLLERRAAVEVPRDRAVQDRVQLLLYIVCRKELPALILIGQHRQQILPQSGLAQRGNIPRLSALRRRIMYKAAEQREEL